jgi:hypothetical protein
MKQLHKQGYKDTTVIASSDKVNEYKTILNKHNGKDYTFKSINVVSSGQRDPEGNYKNMRIAAEKNNNAKFKSGLSAGVQKHADRIMGILRRGMKLEQVMNEAVWDKPMPKKAKQGPLTPLQKSKAKARAKAAGRPYPNMVDNIWASRNEDFDPKRLGANPGKFKRLVSKHLGAKAAEKIGGTDGNRIMAKAKKSNNTTLYRQGSFIKNFYGEGHEEGTDGARKAFIAATPGQRDAIKRAKKLLKFRTFYEEAKKTLNKPFRTSGGRKKFSVYVRNDKGNTVKVSFGDPNLSIKRDNPARRRSFRARHNCDSPGPKTKAKYWSCRMWSNKKVSDIA